MQLEAQIGVAVEIEMRFENSRSFSLDEFWAPLIMNKKEEKQNRMRKSSERAFSD